MLIHCTFGVCNPESYLNFFRLPRSIRCHPSSCLLQRRATDRSPFLSFLSQIPPPPPLFSLTQNNSSIRLLRPAAPTSSPIAPPAAPHRRRPAPVAPRPPATTDAPQQHLRTPQQQGAPALFSTAGRSSHGAGDPCPCGQEEAPGTSSALLLHEQQQPPFYDRCTSPAYGVGLSCTLGTSSDLDPSDHRGACPSAPPRTTGPSNNSSKAPPPPSRPPTSRLTKCSTIFPNHEKQHQPNGR